MLRAHRDVEIPPRHGGGAGPFPHWLAGALRGHPELKSCQVLRAWRAGDYDAVLISEFADQAALEAYKNDPRHKAVSALCKSIRTDRAAVDCLLPDPEE